MEDCKFSNEITYSIIIPHKNSPDLLRRCLDSIPHREDVQIIVVDDNSDSSKVDFTPFPGMNESNTEVYFTKEGRGAGYARNVGLKYAKGKWLLFVDADDYFVEGFISHLDKYRDSEYDIVFFRTTSIYPDTGEMAMRHLFDEECIKEAINNGNFNKLRYQRTSPVSKMIRCSLVKDNQVFFDEVIAANDALFSIKTGYYACKVAADCNAIYVITVRKGSLEYTYSSKILLSRIEVDKRIAKFYDEHNIDEYICVMRYIVQLRKVSISLFIQHLFCSFLMHPIKTIKDILYLYNLKKKSMKNGTRMSVEKNNTYIQLEG